MNVSLYYTNNYRNLRSTQLGDLDLNGVPVMDSTNASASYNNLNARNNCFRLWDIYITKERSRLTELKEYDIFFH